MDYLVIGVLVVGALAAVAWSAAASMSYQARGAIASAPSGGAPGYGLGTSASFYSHSFRSEGALPSQAAVLASVHGAAPAVHADIEGDGDRDSVARLAPGKLCLWRNDGSGRFVQAPGARASLRQAFAPPALVRAIAARASLDTSIDAQAVVSFVGVRIGPVQVRAGPAADRPRRLPKPALPSFGPPRAPPLRFV